LIYILKGKPKCKCDWIRNIMPIKHKYTTNTIAKSTYNVYNYLHQTEKNANFLYNVC